MWRDYNFRAKITVQDHEELIREMVKLSIREEHNETNTTATKKYYSI